MGKTQGVKKEKKEELLKGGNPEKKCRGKLPIKRDPRETIFRTKETRKKKDSTHRKDRREEEVS